MKFLVSTMRGLPPVQLLQNEMFQFINSFPVDVHRSVFQKTAKECLALRKAKKAFKKCCPVGYKPVTIAKA